MKSITEDGEIIDAVTYEPVAMAPIYFKTPWNHDRDMESFASGLKCRDPSKTQQQFAKDAEINEILSKFGMTGGLPTTGAPTFGDAEKFFDLQDEMVTAYDVEQAWLALTPAQRNTLKDPKTFADYVEHCMETGDLDPLRELGLAKPRTTPEPTKQADPPPGGAPDPEPPAKAPSGAKTDK